MIISINLRYEQAYQIEISKIRNLSGDFYLKLKGHYMVLFSRTKFESSVTLSVSSPVYQVYDQ